MLDPGLIDRIAAAIESAEVGYSLTLTRLVDGERTYTLTYSDGTPPLTFDDIDDGYLHISERKRRAQAAAVIAALEPPDIDGGRFTEWSLATIARQCRVQSREQLDPEFSQFMAEVSNRLFGVLAESAATDTHAALKTALDHIEHMAAFIGNQKAGYSFESLGEDMPGMRAALKASGKEG